MIVWGMYRIIMLNNRIEEDIVNHSWLNQGYAAVLPVRDAPSVVVPVTDSTTVSYRDDGRISLSEPFIVLTIKLSPVIQHSNSD